MEEKKAMVICAEVIRLKRELKLAKNIAEKGENGNKKIREKVEKDR